MKAVSVLAGWWEMMTKESRFVWMCAYLCVSEWEKQKAQLADLISSLIRWECIWDKRIHMYYFCTTSQFVNALTLAQYVMLFWSAKKSAKIALYCRKEVNQCFLFYIFVTISWLCFSIMSPPLAMILHFINSYWLLLLKASVVLLSY